MAFSVTHLITPNSISYTLSAPAGGQFSTFIPKDNPFDERMSLISFKDFLPKLGAFNKSLSFLCIKSPI